VPLPKPTVAKISIFCEDGDDARGLGIDKGDQMRIKMAVTLSFKHILGRQAPFCAHEGAKLRRAVEFIEERESRLAVCESG